MASQTAAAETVVYRIGEAATLLGLEPYVLRYWETEFPVLRPAKGVNGQRLYRPTDIEILLTIKRLLYEEGFTIAGARKRLAESEPHPRPEKPRSSPPAEDKTRQVLQSIRAELQGLLTLLSRW